MSATNVTEKQQVEFCFDIWEYCIKPFLFSAKEFPKTCQSCSKEKNPNELHSWRHYGNSLDLEYVCEKCWCDNIRRWGIRDDVKHSILNIIRLEAIPYNQQRAKASRVFNSICDNKVLFKQGEQSLYLEKVVIQAIISHQNAFQIHAELEQTKAHIKFIKVQQTHYRQLLKTDVTENQKIQIKEELNINAALIKTLTLENDIITYSIYIKCPVVITL